jgi:hypothetical protein
MKNILMAMVACGALAGCAMGQPESAGQQADDAACTAQADAVYHSQTIDEQARTAQPGLIYGATPTHVFDAEQLGAAHVRDSAIANCEQNGAGASGPEVDGTPVVTPHIVGTP